VDDDRALRVLPADRFHFLADREGGRELLDELAPERVLE